MRRRMSMALGNSDEKDAARMATLFNPNKPAVKVKGGWMDKAGEKNTAWKRRWFELVDHDTLTYTSEPGGKPKGAIDLHLCQRVRANPESPLLLEVASAERQFQLRCDTEKERQDWLGVLYAATRALHAGDFVPDLSEDPALQQLRKGAWEAWQDTTAEPRASVALSSVSESDGDGAGRDYKLLSVRIERTLQFEKHAEYEIVTSYEAADGNSGVQESLVSRRYSEFRKLEKAISDVIEGLPPVPGKTMSRHGAADTGDATGTRLSGLVKFLAALPELTGTGGNRDVLQFLGVITVGVLSSGDERKLLFHTALQQLEPLAEKVGWLHKEGQRNKKRKKRWGVLVSGAGVARHLEQSDNEAASWGDSGDRWLLYYESQSSEFPKGTVELPSEGYTVTWSTPASASESASAGIPSPGGAGGGPAPPQLQIELTILYGNDRGRKLVLELDTEDIWISWLTTLRGGARQPPQPWGHQRPRNPTFAEVAMLDDLATALPPAGAIAQGEEVGERDSALLKRFWVAFFGPEIEGGPPFVLRGEGWKQAGFQRDDPISDLRACGLLALQQLVYFVEEHGDLARAMCAAQRGDDALAFYPWATAGVAVTQMLATFFELMQPSGVTGSFKQARRGFWAYIGDANVGREAYDLLYVIGFELLDREYRESNATYLTFPGVLSRTRDMFLEAVLSTPPDPAGPFATVLRVAQDLCSPLTGAIIDRLKLERDRAEAAPAVSATVGAVAAPPVEAGSAEQYPYGQEIIALRVEDSDGLAETGVELSFSAHEIGNDMGELVRRVCDKLHLGKGLGEDFGWSFEDGVLRPNHSLHVEIFDDTHGEWFTPDVLDEIERDADMQHEPLRLRLRPC